MSEEEKEEQNKLHGEPQPEKKKRRWWRYAIDAVVGLLLVSTCLVCANLIYINTTYNEPFFVRGVSMYPMLNGNAKDANGKTMNWISPDLNNGIGCIVDYGYAKVGNKGNWRASLKRLDIVVCYYPEDYQRDPENPSEYLRDDKGNYVLKTTPGIAPKIKRVIGMPGETIQFSNVGDEDPNHGNAAFGWTYLTPTEGDPYYLKPLWKVDDYIFRGKDESDSAYQSRVNSYNARIGSCGPTVLDEDEYFVMGDNRGNSTDSRSTGPLKKEWIVGKAYLVTGMRKLVKKGNNTEAEFQLGYTRWPWQYKHLDRH